MCFHVNFAKFLRTLFLQNTSGRQPLVIAILIVTAILFSEFNEFLNKFSKIMYDR